MPATILQMPANHQQSALNLPSPRIWTIDDLAKFLRVSRSWVEKRTKQIPHSNTKPITFDTGWDEFQNWLKGVIQPKIDKANSDE